MPLPNDETPGRLPENYHGTRRAGAPTALTPELQADFARLIRAGNYFETVCDFMGIVRETARRWMRLGGRVHRRLQRHPEQEAELTPDESRCLGFFAAIRQADAASEMSDLAIIGTVAQGRPRQVRRTHLPDGTTIEEVTEGMAPNYQAAAWRLTRKRPMRYGQTAPIKVQHEGTKDGPPISHDVQAQVTFYLPDNGRTGPQVEENGDDVTPS